MSNAKVAMGKCLSSLAQGWSKAKRLERRFAELVENGQAIPISEFRVLVQAARAPLDVRRVGDIEEVHRDAIRRTARRCGFSEDETRELAIEGQGIVRRRASRQKKTSWRASPALSASKPRSGHSFPLQRSTGSSPKLPGALRLGGRPRGLEAVVHGLGRVPLLRRASAALHQRCRGI